MSVRTANVHVMIDIETLGNGNNAAMWALGAVKFVEGDKFAPTNFYVTIDPEDCVRRGMDMDVSTVLWWMDPKQDAARGELARAQKEGIDLATALEGFSRWLPPKENITAVWGNGATFDNVILRNAFRCAGVPVPWDFRKDLCYRTLKNTMPFVARPPAKGTQHIAIDDAVWQAEHLFNLLRHVNISAQALVG